MFDILIKNGKVIDGTGSPAYFADVAVKDGKIVKVKKGIKGDAKQIIDATGLVVTPGFIDSHGHNDSFVLSHPEMTEKVEQGITTTIAGQCGDSIAPISNYIKTPKQIGDFGIQLDLYKTMGTLLDIAKNVPQGSNTGILMGHSQLRRAVMGLENRAPTAEEMQKMKDLVRDGMEHGAMGVSFGLFYAPGCYAEVDECIELAKIVKEYEGIITSHIRDEADYLIRSTKEFIAIVKGSGCRGVISHHTSYEKEENWGKVTHTLRMIDETNAEGYDLYCDVYPYIASHTNMQSMFIPREDRSAGLEGLTKMLEDPQYRERVRNINVNYYGKTDLDWVQVTICPGNPEFSGRIVGDIAREKGQDPYETLFDIMHDSKVACSACYFTMCEEDVETVMAHSRTMICTDSGIAAGKTFFHPRLSASFTRTLGEYVCERGVTTLPEMIRKMTAMPAAVYGLKTKGLIWDNMDADICIFDADKIVDKASFTDCKARAEGLNYVIIGGEIVAENAVHNGKRCGKVLLRED